MRPHRRQPSRLSRPWDSPGKNTGVGCHFLLQCMKVKSESEVAQSCPTLRLRPHGLQPTRLLRPWDFPGKSTGVGCHRLLHREGIHLGKGSQGFQPPGLGRESSGGSPSGLRGSGLEAGNGAQARAIQDLDGARKRWCRPETSLGRTQLTSPQLLEWRQSRAHRLRPGLKAP